MSGLYIIFGAGDLAHTIARFLPTKIMAFCVDQSYFSSIVPKDKTILPYSKARIEDFLETTSASFINCVGYNSLSARERVHNKLESDGFDLANIILDSNVSHATIQGKGNIIFPGCYFEPGVEINHGNLFWTRTTLCHDVVVNSNNFFASGSIVGGFTKIGSRNFFGFSSTIDSHRKIGDDNLVGANSFVKHHISNSEFVVGSPSSSKSSRQY